MSHGLLAFSIIKSRFFTVIFGNNTVHIQTNIYPKGMRTSSTNTLLLVCLLVTVSCQTHRSTAPDLSQVDAARYAVRIDSIWQVVRTHYDKQEYDVGREVQEAYALEFATYYGLYPNTSTGKHALSSAFIMWGNLGATKEIEHLLPEIDPSSDVWALLINAMRSAYVSTNRTDAFINLLHDLEPVVQDPSSLAGIQLNLGEYYREQGKPEQAMGYYSSILSLQADSFYTHQAEGYLHELENLRPGNVAPTFETADLQGLPLTLAQTTGKVTLLDFWATWCGPCIPELPHLRALREQYTDQDFALISFSFDDSLSTLQAFLAEEDLPWQHAFVQNKWQDRLARLYNVTSLPRNYLLNRQGIIIGKDLRGPDLAEAVAAAILMP